MKQIKEMPSVETHEEVRAKREEYIWYCCRKGAANTMSTDLHASDEMKQELDDQVDKFRMEITKHVERLQGKVDNHNQKLENEFKEIDRQLIGLQHATKHEKHSQKKVKDKDIARRKKGDAEAEHQRDVTEAAPDLDATTLTLIAEGAQVRTAVPLSEVHVGTIDSLGKSSDDTGHGFIKCASTHRVYGHDVFFLQKHRVGIKPLEANDYVSFVVLPPSRVGHNGFAQARQVCTCTKEEAEKIFRGASAPLHQQGGTIDTERGWPMEQEEQRMTEAATHEEQCMVEPGPTSASPGQTSDVPPCGECQGGPVLRRSQIHYC